jgi:hypothetical protein
VVEAEEHEGRSEEHKQQFHPVVGSQPRPSRLFRNVSRHHRRVICRRPAGHSWRALRFARIARYITACQTRTHWRALLESLAACLPSIACSAIGKCCTCAAAFTLDTRHSAHRSQAIARPSCWRQRPNTRNPRRRLWRCDGTLLGPSRTRDEAAIVYRNRSPSSPAREATPPLGAS